MKTRLKQLIQFTDDYEQKEAFILRDHLAMERTKLANERTLLSYIRASLYLLLGGIAILGLKEYQELHLLGYLAISISIILIIIGVFRYYQLRKHLRKMYILGMQDRKDRREKLKKTPKDDNRLTQE